MNEKSDQIEAKKVEFVVVFLIYILILDWSLHISMITDIIIKLYVFSVRTK